MADTDFRQVLRGDASVTIVKRAEPFPLPPPAQLDTIIRVDRAIRPVYPDWVKKVMHPKLEGTGPTEDDLATLQLWLHDGQKDGIAVGNRIYDYLKSNNMLEGCLGLADLVEIHEEGYRRLPSVLPRQGHLRMEDRRAGPP